MTDARWRDVFSDIVEAREHFSRAVERFAGFPNQDAITDYDGAMAFMHMMQSGQTSAETALRRVLGIVAEELPTGPESHARLIDRCAEPIDDTRPRILSRELRDALDETRQFRHVAMHAYRHLDRRKARFAVDAAQVVVGRLEIELSDFRNSFDPPE